MVAVVEARERLTEEDYRKLQMGGKKTCHFDPLCHTHTSIITNKAWTDEWR